jgi:hypothetical protein
MDQHNCQLNLHNILMDNKEHNDNYIKIVVSMKICRFYLLDQHMDKVFHFDNNQGHSYYFMDLHIDQEMMDKYLHIMFVHQLI